MMIDGYGASDAVPCGPHGIWAPHTWLRRDGSGSIAPSLAACGRGGGACGAGCGVCTELLSRGPVPILRKPRRLDGHHWRSAERAAPFAAARIALPSGMALACMLLRRRDGHRRSKAKSVHETMTGVMG